ncbi:YdcF family protein [uncultured Cohaesibacter sp.]|uniref:YdcF family protein n=1 Tax=uncultured Cohaesibacter sp. TaxID=1002546 RepID=UPI00292E422D|nr:YdcF family protein [uncultured Cohaesibacter sp.]
MIATFFYVLSKIVALLLLVESWLFIGILVSLIALWRRALGVARAVLSLTFLLLVIILSPLPDIVMMRLETAYPANPELINGGPVEGIIILGGSIIPSHTERWHQIEVNASVERVIEAARLARSLPEAKILISGGSASPLDIVRQSRLRSEAEITRDLFVDLGFDTNRILIETGSRNTAENATLSAALIGDDKTKRWILITSAFHMPRSVRSFERAGFTNLIPYPVDHRTNLANTAFSWYPKTKFLRADLTIKELVGLFVYGLTGR